MKLATRLLFLLLTLALPARAAASGEDLFVATAAVSGNASLPAPELLAGADIRPGAPWNEELARLDADILASMYRSRGFMDAEISVGGLTSGASVFLEITVNEGRQYTFGATTVTGLSKLRPQTVRKELSYRKGQPFSQQLLLNSQSQLYSTEWFESLRTRISSSSASTVIGVELRAEEKPMKWVRGGVGYGSEEKERFSLGVTHNNFLNRGYKLDVSGQLSRIWLEYRAELTNRHFLESRTEFHDSVVWRRERRSGYDMESTKNTSSWGRKLGAGFSGAVQYRLQRTLIYNVDPALSQESPSVSSIRAAGLSFNRDTTDDFFYPGKGLRSELALERSGGLWGGDINLYKFSFKNTAYQRLLPGVIGVLSARWAFVHETGNTPDVPIYERLFTGGANSVRGYAERGVGPTDASGNPFGGKLLLGASAEFRLPIYKKLRGALFLDGGQVADSLQGAAPRNWKYGAGAGLRYITPVGPIRVDFGYKLNPDKPALAELWRVHLSIGEAF